MKQKCLYGVFVWFTLKKGSFICLADRQLPSIEFKLVDEARGNIPQWGFQGGKLHLIHVKKITFACETLDTPNNALVDN